MANKASMDDLNSLHAMVARELANNLDDPKTLAMAIKFLKDNDVVVDVIESESMMSITDSIKRIAAEAKAEKFSVEDMIAHQPLEGSLRRFKADLYNRTRNVLERLSEAPMSLQGDI